MYALGDSAERILVLMDSLLSSPPVEMPSVDEMFVNLENYLGVTGSAHLELKETLLALITQALRLGKVDMRNDVRLVDFLKYVKRQQKAKVPASEPISGSESWFSDEKFQNAFGQTGSNSDISENLRSFSDSRRIVYSATFVESDGSSSRRIEITLSGRKYPHPTFDMNMKLYVLEKLEADIFLSELLLRSPWKVADLDSVQLDRSLSEVMHFGSSLLTSFMRS